MEPIFLHGILGVGSSEISPSHPFLQTGTSLLFSQDTNTSSCNGANSGTSESPSLSQKTQHASGDVPTTSSSCSIPRKGRVVERPKAAIPRPPNAWILYRSAKIREKSGKEWQAMQKGTNVASSSKVKQEQEKQDQSFTTPTPASSPPTRGSTVQAFCSKKVAEMWRAEGEEVKQHFHALAKQKKEEHEKLFPGYVFKPQSRKDQIVKAETESQKQESITRLNTDGHTKMIHVEKAIKSCPDNSHPSTSQGSESEKAPTHNSIAAIEAKVKTRRPASTAKTKAKMPELFIDVLAAEKTVTTSSFTNLLNAPFSALCTDSALDHDAQWQAYLTQTSIGQDTEMSEIDSAGLVEIFKQIDKDGERSESMNIVTDTNGTGCTEGTTWTTFTESPLPLTSVEATRPATGKSRLREACNGQSSSTSEAVSTAKKKPTRRKSTSNAGLKRQSKAAVKATVSSRSSESPVKKLKKALICKDVSKLASCSEKPKEPATEQHTTVNISQVENEVYHHIEHASPSRMNTLSQSYDRQGIDSDVEDALLCADTLLESFANMPAWSPHQGWFDGTASNGISDNLLGNAIQLQGSVNHFQGNSSSIPDQSTSWALYSQPDEEVVSTLSQYQWTCNEAAQGSRRQEQVSSLQCEANASEESAQLMSFVSPICNAEEASQSASFAPLTELENNSQEEPSTLEFLSDQQWNSLLTESVFETCENQQQTTAQSAEVEVLPDGLWNLIRFDPNSQDTNGAPATLNISPQRSQGKDPGNVPVVEMTGVFTEKELLEKLKLLRRISQEGVT